MNSQWMKVKGENDTTGLYTAFFISLGVIAAVIAISVIHKHKMKKYYEV